MHRYESVNNDTQQNSPGTSYAETKFSEPCDTFLPPKTFLAAKRSTLKRGLYQSSVGLGTLVLWAAIFVLWQWALNNRAAYYLNDYYYFGSSDWMPQLLLSSYGDSGSCDAGSYSSLDPNLLVRGNFTLSEVKAMDVAFNMVVGRGTQALLLWITYYTTTDILMRLTESIPVRLELFSALAFNHSSVLTIYLVLKGLFTLRGWRAKFIMAWIFISSVFLVILPTLIDTMSGYIQNQRKDAEYFEGISRVTVDYDSFNITAWRSNHSSGDWNLVCTPQGGYQWGLAEVWVSITIILFGFWLLGTFTIWMDAQHACELRRKGRGFETLRAVVDLAGVVTETLGEDISAYSGKELGKRMGKTPQVIYGTEVDENSGLERIRLSTRRTRELGKLSWDTIYG